MPKKKQAKFGLRNIPWWSGAILVAVAGFLLYYLTMPWTNVGYADSDELLSVAFHAGVAHPPGYPLYILMLHGFMQLPLEMNPAAMGHLLSVLLASVTLAIVFLGAYQLSQLIPRRKKDFVLVNSEFEAFLIAGLSTTGLALSFLFWTYGHIAEKVILTGLFSALLGSLYIWYLQTKASKRIYIWVSIWVVYGFAVAHHQSLVLFIVPNLLLLWQGSKAEIGRSILPAIFGAIFGIVASLLVLWMLNSNSAAVSWEFEPTINGLVDHLTRQDFAGQIYSQGQETGAYFRNIDIAASLDALWQYILVTIEHFGYWILLIGILALRFGPELAKKPFLVLGVAYALVGPFLAAYLRYPEDWGSQAIAQRQFIAGYTLLPLLLVFGFRDFFQRFGKAITILAHPKAVVAVLVLVPMAWFGVRLYVLIPTMDLHDYDLVHKKFHEMMLEFEPNSLVTCYSDVSCFALMYEKYVLKTREDVQIVPLTYPLIEDELLAAELQRFTYDSNPFMLFDIVTWNIDKRPVYAVEINEFYYDLYGLGVPVMYYVPYGYYGQLSKNMPENFSEYDNELTSSWLETPVPAIDTMRRFHKSSVGRDHLINGSVVLAAGNRTDSLSEFNQAANIFYEFDEKEQQQINKLRADLERVQPSEDYAPGSSLTSAEEMLGYLPDLLESNLLNRAYQAAKGAVIIEPENIQARLYLAEVYEKTGSLGFAQLEYLHALMIDPENQSAQDGYSRLLQQ